MATSPSLTNRKWSAAGSRRPPLASLAGRSSEHGDAEALENETRHLFGGLTKAELTQLGPDGRLPFHVRLRRRPGFDAFLRAELLGERSPAPRDEAGLSAHAREELLAEPSLKIRDRLTFDARLRAELLVEGSAVQYDG
jgi:hypothetical protein